MIVFSGQTLRQARTDAGMTREQLSRLVDVGQGTVYEWERGTNVPGGNAVARLALALNLDRLEALYVPA